MYERIVSYATPEATASRHPVTSVMGGAEGAGGSARLSHRESSLEYVGTLAILRSSGRPQEIGEAHGRLLGAAIQPPTAAATDNIALAVASSGFLASSTHSVRLRWRYRLLDDGVPGHQLAEIASLLAGARRSTGSAPDYEAFVRAQAVFDVGKAAPWSSGSEFRAMARSLSFASKLRGPSGDRLIIGRSFALPGSSDGGDQAAARVLVSFVRPDSVIAYASVGWPGLVGVVSGLNAEGIAIMVHPARTADVTVTRDAQPIALLARDVLENARTLGDAISILEHNKPLGAAAIVIVDGNARACAVVERSPDRFSVTRDPRPCLAGDVLVTQAFADDAENDRAGRVRPSRVRLKRVSKLLGKRLESPEDFAAILRDRRDPDGAPLPLGHRGAIYDPSAVHAALFDVSGMVLWVADEADAQGTFRSFDLRHELRREGNRPATPADLRAADSRDRADSLRVRTARTHLRAARRKWRAGSLRRASEEVERALASAPELPEALYLAGELASARGERERARQYQERYMNGKPDDLGAAQEIRAVLGN